ncbi:MAG: hypothetical protein HY538_08710 [Deltaproteobacteria bacterium]|nr:hypothetical protein [Deltaproteobacteria bacterium]
MKWVVLTVSLSGLLLFNASCSIKAAAVNALVPSMYDMIETSYQGKDSATVGEALPTFIVLMEGMVGMSPKNQELLALAGQLNAFYAMGFMEQQDPKRAIRLYERGVELGMEALKRNKKFRNSLARGDKFREATPYLKKDDLLPAFWTLMAWALLLQLKLDDPKALFDLPKVTALLNRVMELDDTYFFGAPHLLQGALYTILPAMAGGGPDKAQAEFGKLFAISGDRFMLGHVYYAQNYATLIKDKALFESELQLVLDTPSEVLTEMPIANEMAKDLARKLLAKKDELF